MKVTLTFITPGTAAQETVVATPLGPRLPSGMGGWSQRYQIEGAVYWVGISMGRRARIMFKPRGQNWGHKWNGYVREDRGHTLWQEEVGGSLGAKGLLLRAIDQLGPYARDALVQAILARRAVPVTNQTGE